MLWGWFEHKALLTLRSLRSKSLLTFLPLGLAHLLKYLSLYFFSHLSKGLSDPLGLRLLRFLLHWVDASRRCTVQRKSSAWGKPGFFSALLVLLRTEMSRLPSERPGPQADIRSAPSRAHCTPVHSQRLFLPTNVEVCPGTSAQQVFVNACIQMSPLLLLQSKNMLH